MMILRRNRNLNWEARQSGEVLSEPPLCPLHTFTLTQCLCCPFFFKFYFLPFLLSDSLSKLLKLELWLIQSCPPKAGMLPGI